MLCIIICFYNNFNIIQNLICFFDNLNIDYHFYAVLNNFEILNNIDKNNYPNNIFFIEGDNTIYEFTGIQKCLDNINKDLYNSFILGTDALFNYPMYYLDYINKSMIEYTYNNKICVGNIDSFNKSYKCNNFTFKYWLRTSFIIINKNAFKDINYKFITINNINESIYVSPELVFFLNTWLDNERYNYLNDDIKKKIKLTCIYNEYSFTNKIKEVAKIYDFMIVYKFKFLRYSLCNNHKKILINNFDYVDRRLIKYLKKMKPEEQLKFKIKFT
jgi:hypothetical protein